jgi:hypothetical protein
MRTNRDSRINNRNDSRVTNNNNPKRKASAQKNSTFNNGKKDSSRRRDTEYDDEEDFDGGIGGLQKGKAGKGKVGLLDTQFQKSKAKQPTVSDVSEPKRRDSNRGDV